MEWYVPAPTAGTRTEFVGSAPPDTQVSFRDVRSGVSAKSIDAGDNLDTYFVHGSLADLTNELVWTVGVGKVKQAVMREHAGERADVF